MNETTVIDLVQGIQDNKILTKAIVTMVKYAVNERNILPHDIIGSDELKDMFVVDGSSQSGDDVMDKDLYDFIYKCASDLENINKDLKIALGTVAVNKLKELKIYTFEHFVNYNILDILNIFRLNSDILLALFIELHNKKIVFKEVEVKSKCRKTIKNKEEKVNKIKELYNNIIDSSTNMFIKRVFMERARDMVRLMMEKPLCK
jgi:hypothetical protein